MANVHAQEVIKVCICCHVHVSLVSDHAAISGEAVDLVALATERALLVEERCIGIPIFQICNPGTLADDGVI
jgi:hypothetical protein